jgi:hypothetical protein
MLLVSGARGDRRPGAADRRRAEQRRHFPLDGRTTPQGLDLAYATNYLGRDAGAVLVFVSRYLLSPLAPKYWSTPKRAARVITEVLTSDSDATGLYYDESGRLMLGSAQVRDPEYSDRVVAETRALLSALPAA